MYSKEIIIIGGGGGRHIGLGRAMRIDSNIPITTGDFLVHPNGFVDYVEPIVINPNTRLYYQRFDRPYGKNYRRTK